MKDLVQHLRRGYGVVTDNFFTSLQLAVDLKTQYNMSFIGTVNPSRRGIHDALKKSSNKAVGSTLTLYNKDFIATSWVPVKNRAVIMLSTEHDDVTMVEVDGQEKPNIVADYNEYKAAVDNSDKMCKVYSCKRATRRYSLILFFHILDVATINSHILFNLNKDKKMSRFKFIRQIGHDLIFPLIQERLVSGILNGVHIRIRNNIRSTLNDKCLIEKTRKEDLMSYLGKRPLSQLIQENESTESSSPSTKKASRPSAIRCSECQKMKIYRQVRNQCKCCNQAFCSNHGKVATVKWCIQCLNRDY